MDARDWETLKDSPFFRGIDEDTVRSIIIPKAPKILDRGAIVFQQSDSADAFYLVLEGWVKLYRETPGGEDVVVAIFAAGETFAEVAMFLGGRYPATAETVTPCRLLRIDGKALRAGILERPQLAFDMLAAASLHLKMMVEQIEQIKIRSAPERVAEFLLRLAPLDAEGAVVIGLPYEKALIANRLGMKPESFSRALAKLREIGVTVERDHVSIADIDRLADIVESNAIDISD